MSGNHWENGGDYERVKGFILKGPDRPFIFSGVGEVSFSGKDIWKDMMR